MSFRFVRAGAFFGPEAGDAMSPLVRAQLRAMLADGGEGATSMRTWCEHWATELDQSAGLFGVEVWDVLEGDAREPRFTLLYNPDSDSGLLFHAGTADPVGLALWPEGFRPNPPDRAVGGIDVGALSRACAAREARVLEIARIGDVDVVILYRPAGPAEMALVRASGMKRWPPRLEEQPIFYPVTNEQYAREIAERWNVPESGGGYVTRFAVRADAIARYPAQTVGARHHTELWIPAEELDALNDAIVGEIEIVATYG